MKVLLKKDVYNLGFAGEVHDVAPGYGRNYLIPQGMAVKATPGTMQQAEIWRQQAEVRRAELKAEYETLSTRIAETTLTFVAKAGETGKLYGSITTAQVTESLNELLGTNIDHRKVGTGTLRELGEHKVIVRLSADFQPEVTVVIESDEETEEEVSEMAVEALEADSEEETEETEDVAESEAGDEPVLETE
jgi:large subunit ribosomal protein L9